MSTATYQQLNILKMPMGTVNSRLLIDSNSSGTHRAANVVRLCFNKKSIVSDDGVNLPTNKEDMRPMARLLMLMVRECHKLARAGSMLSRNE
jgi:hypothetical protein